jgi:GT2 family glycosyltransferase
MNSVNLAIDVVVPSIRVDFEKLDSIVNLKVPEGVTTHFYFVIDQPDISEISVRNHFLVKEVSIIKNKTNLGAHLSRNKGFEAGSGEYVLFLDDDAEVPQILLEKYFEAITNNPNCIGFIGPVSFPSCTNAYTKAAVASDILTFWDIAKSNPNLAWGITANLLVKRAAVGDIRFSAKFPKKGGGEDVDFCLRIVEGANSWFTSVPDAEIIHPWWNKGHQQFRRFARWAYGDSTLPNLYPKYKFRNVPNFPESALVLFLLGIVGLAFFGVTMSWFLAWFVIGFVLELFMDGLRMRLAGKKQSLIVSLVATLIRLSNDLGRIIGNLKNLNILGVTERFDYFMTKEHINYERTVAYLKFSAYCITGVVLFLIFR